MISREYPQKGFVWITLFFIALVIVGTSLSMKANSGKAIEIDVEGQPTLGHPDAPLHIVVFEEPKCPSCRDFSKDIYPKLKKEYIDTGKVKFTLFMVSFLPNSEPAAEAMLAVYDNNPANTQLFYDYVEYIYQHQPDERLDWAKPALLIEFARKTSRWIDLNKLSNSIDEKRYASDIQRNTQYGQGIMGGSLSTPKIYVNGLEKREMSYEILSNYLQDLLKKPGGG